VAELAIVRDGIVFSKSRLHGNRGLWPNEQRGGRICLRANKIPICIAIIGGASLMNEISIISSVQPSRLSILDCDNRSLI